MRSEDRASAAILALSRDRPEYTQSRGNMRYTTSSYMEVFSRGLGLGLGLDSRRHFANLSLSLSPSPSPKHRKEMLLEDELMSGGDGCHA